MLSAIPGIWIIHEKGGKFFFALKIQVFSKLHKWTKHLLKQNLISTL